MGKKLIFKYRGSWNEDLLSLSIDKIKNIFGLGVSRIIIPPSPRPVSVLISYISSFDCSPPFFPTGGSRYM